MIILFRERGLRYHAVLRDAGGQQLFLEMGRLNGFNLMQHPQGGRQVPSTVDLQVGKEMCSFRSRLVCFEQRNRRPAGGSMGLERGLGLPL